MAFLESLVGRRSTISPPPNCTPSPYPVFFSFTQLHLLQDFGARRERERTGQFDDGSCRCGCDQAAPVIGSGEALDRSPRIGRESFESPPPLETGPGLRRSRRVVVPQGKEVCSTPEHSRIQPMSLKLLVPRLQPRSPLEQAHWIPISRKHG